MGLDVSAVKNAVLVDDPKVSEAEYLDYIFGGHFPRRLGSLIDGAYYDGDPADSHYRNGYGRHGLFREKLAELAGYDAKISPKPNYSDPDFMNKHYGHTHPFSMAAWEAGEGPFFELIMFSDCEGFIGPEVCQKLAEDFQRFSDKVNLSDDDWLKGSFFDLRAVFEDGAQGGYVKFR